MKRLNLLYQVIGLILIALILSACGTRQPDPVAAQKHHNQGMLGLMTLGGERNPEEAIKDFTKAIEADPSFVKSYNVRGVAYVLLRDYDKARIDFEKALEIDPSYDLARKNLEHLDAGEYDLVTGVEM